jgi:hypothetical protein
MAGAEAAAVRLAWGSLGLALSVPVILALDAVVRAPLAGGYNMPRSVMLAQPAAAVAALWLGIAAQRKMTGKRHEYWISLGAIGLSAILLVIWVLWAYIALTIDVN